MCSFEGLFLLIYITLQGELGANAILAVSIAACKAGAAEKEAWCFIHVFLITSHNFTLEIIYFTWKVLRN